MEYLKAACEHLGVEPERVMSHHLYEDHIALVVDNGIAGCPKYRVPLSELTGALQAGEHVLEEAEIPDNVSIAGANVQNVTVNVQEAPEEDRRDIEATGGAVKLAAEHGLSLAGIRGSGAGGRVTKRDVQEALDELGDS